MLDRIDYLASFVVFKIPSLALILKVSKPDRQECSEKRSSNPDKRITHRETPWMPLTLRISGPAPDIQGYIQNSSRPQLHAFIRATGEAARDVSIPGEPSLRSRRSSNHDCENGDC